MPKAGTTVERGYGAAHKRLRKLWEPRVARGGVLCRRCKQPIDPAAKWDLGHDPLDRSLPAVPEHPICNRGNRAEVIRRQSREW